MAATHVRGHQLRLAEGGIAYVAARAPNMVGEPVRHVRAAASAFRFAGATLVAGHSAHVFHGVSNRVAYDLGDFIDDYPPIACCGTTLGFCLSCVPLCGTDVGQVGERLVIDWSADPTTAA